MNVTDTLIVRTKAGILKPTCTQTACSKVLQWSGLGQKIVAFIIYTKEAQFLKCTYVGSS